jgi:hypothetical protein
VTPGPPRTSQWPEPSVHQIQDGSTRVCGAEASEAPSRSGCWPTIPPWRAGRSARRFGLRHRRGPRRPGRGRAHRGDQTLAAAPGDPPAGSPWTTSPSTGPPAPPPARPGSSGRSPPTGGSTSARPAAAAGCGPAAPPPARGAASTCIRTTRCCGRIGPAPPTPASRPPPGGTGRCRTQHRLDHPRPPPRALPRGDQQRRLVAPASRRGQPPPPAHPRPDPHRRTVASRPRLTPRPTIGPGAGSIPARRPTSLSRFSAATHTPLDGHCPPCSAGSWGGTGATRVHRRVIDGGSRAAHERPGVQAVLSLRWVVHQIQGETVTTQSLIERDHFPSVSSGSDRGGSAPSTAVRPA